MVADERSEEVKRVVLMALSVVLALVLASPIAFAQAEQRAQSTRSSVELAAAWWQWALSKPADVNPLFGGDPDYSQAQCNGEPVTATQGDTWFLAGSAGSDPVERTCSMPAGSQLFFPIVNYAWVFTDPETDTDKLARESVQGFMRGMLSDPEFSMTVTVDGREVHRIVRAKSHFFEVQLPEGNVFGEPAGSYRALADGFWVKLPPLSEGEHTIHWEVSAPNVDTDPDKPGAEGFFQDITYHLTVE
jgi:hypothetical protein